MLRFLHRCTIRNQHGTKFFTLREKVDSARTEVTMHKQTSTGKLKSVESRETQEKRKDRDVPKGEREGIGISSHTLSSIHPLLMAPPPAKAYHLHGFKVAITVAFIFSLIVPLPKSGGSVLSGSRKSLEENKVMIGSKPPACVNKCMNCRPCKATVIVPNHTRNGFNLKLSSHGEDDSYYLLSWKCRCGDKLFPP
ncbi:hypothetical protein VNO77_29405 [Canavalia gladiata]|uniref:Epidermal patterning factor-like protein n=1 Tax=Canavalia gladiata TaxID=3824 RepID=A0AAN9KXQ4_CANGL